MPDGSQPVGVQAPLAEAVQALHDSHTERAPSNGKFFRQESLGHASSSTVSTHDELMSRQCTEVDSEIAAMASEWLSKASICEHVRAAAAECKFCVTVADPSRSDMPLIAVSEEFESMTGFSRKEILGTNCRFLNHNCPLGPKAQAGFRAACRTGAYFSCVVLNRKKTGELFWNLVDLRGLSVAQDERTGEEMWILVGLQADVTKLFEADMLSDHMPELRNIINGVRARLKQKLGLLAVAGKAAMAAELGSGSEASGPQAGAAGAACEDRWLPLEDPQWRQGEAFPPKEVEMGPMPDVVQATPEHAATMRLKAAASETSLAEAAARGTIEEAAEAVEPASVRAEVARQRIGRKVDNKKFATAPASLEERSIPQGLIAASVGAVAAAYAIRYCCSPSS